MSEYVRRLTKTEFKRSYIIIDKAHRTMFPSPGIYFKISIENQVIDAKVDRFHRIYVGFNVRDLLNFETNRIAVFTKNPDGTYSLSSRKR